MRTLLIGAFAVVLAQGLTVGVTVGVTAARAAPADPAPLLPAPTGGVVRVRTEPELQAAVATLAPGTTILIAPGSYRLTRTLTFRGITGASLRGESSDRDAVTISGPGMSNADYGATPYGVWAGDGVDDLLIANLTLRDFYFHPIILNAGVTRPHIYNVHLVDAGQQFLKSNPDANGVGNGSGVVEYSIFEFTTTGRDDYPKAIDLHGATGWLIRHNLFRNIRAPGNLLNGPAILAWRGSRDTVVEGNTFINCQREVVFGAEAVTPDSHQGGIVRNNFIYRDASLIGDAAISVWDSPNTQVLHNTIAISGTYPNAIEVRFPDTTGVTVTNNLTDAAVTLRDGARAIIQGNVTNGSAGWFVDAPRGDLHLLPSAGAVRHMGVPVSGAPVDWDGDARPTQRPDVGADQL